MSALKSKGRKIFEIPICTICLDPMIKDLCVFTVCGHVFHYNCGVNCHQNSRKCPNCRMRSTELQSLHYAVEEITGVDEQMSQLLSDLSVDQKQHMAKLLADHEEMLHENQKIKQRNKFLEEKNESTQTEIQHLQKEKLSLIEYNKQIDEKKRELQLKVRTLESLYSSLELDVVALKEKIENQEEKIKSHSYLDELQKALNPKTEDMYLKLIRQKSLAEQAQQIYDLYIIKMGQFKVIEKEITQLQEQNESQQRKYDSLSQKYEKLKSAMEEVQKENRFIREQTPFQRTIEQIEDRSREELKRKPKPQMISFGCSQLRKQPLSQSLLKK